MTQDEIKQYALYQLGFEDDLDFTSTTSKPVIRMNFVYDQIIKQVLSRYQWGFALKRAELANGTEVSGQKYKYRHDLPSDFIFLRTAYPSVNSRVGIDDYEFDDLYFYSNNSDVFFDYTYEVTETKFPDYFIEYLKFKLAMELCFNLTGDADLLMFLSEREKFEYVNSTNIDARQRRVKRVSMSPFIDVRG